MGRLLADEVLPVLVLEQHFIRGGKVHDQLGAGHAVEGGRRQRRPEVLADLDGESGGADGKQQVRGHVAAAAGKGDLRAEAFPDEILPVVEETPFVVDVAREEIGSRGEPAGFVEFIVGWDEGLRDNALDLAVPDHDRTVVQLVVVPDRSAKHHRHRLSPGMVPDGGDGRFRPLYQEVRTKKVAAGVPRDSHFREHEQGDRLRFRLVDQPDDFRLIELNISDFHSR